MMTVDSPLHQATFFFFGDGYCAIHVASKALKPSASTDRVSTFLSFAHPQHDETFIVSSSLGGILDGECRPCAFMLCPTLSHKERVDL